MKYLVLLFALIFSSLSSAEISAHSYVVMDQDGNVLFEKNPNDIRSIASITKLYSLSLISPASQQIKITNEESDKLKHTRMRLRNGLYDEIQLIDAALSASNNEASKSLGRAHWLSYEMAQKRFPEVFIVEPSGLDPNNKSSALVLARTAFELSKLPIAEHTLKMTTTVGSTIFRNTNPLLQKHGWDFKLSKTGFINESGGCLLVVMTINNRDYSIAILGSKDTKQRWLDLSQLRSLLSSDPYFQMSNRVAKSK